MSKSAISDSLWAEMNEARRAEAVREGRATLKQMVEGLLDGPNVLRAVCRDFLAHMDASLGELLVETQTRHQRSEEDTDDREDEFSPARTEVVSDSRRRASVNGSRRRRLGLPQGYVFRFYRHERVVLLDQNIYRLPNGQELIPAPPEGILGRHSHRYALLTSEQYMGGERGCVYIGEDGRIFDYSSDSRDPKREMFDTGYTIEDLKRTGRYAPSTLIKAGKTSDEEVG